MLSTHSITATSTKSLAEEAEAAITYSRILRAIGQDLADLFPKVLQIETDGTHFVARGQSHRNPFQQVKKSTYKNIWRHLLGKHSKGEPVSVEAAAPGFTRSYTPEEIENIDRLYRAHRTEQNGRPDSYSLAERLRVMGGIVDSRQGRFKCLRKNRDNLFIEYWDQNGAVQSAKLTTIIMYRNPQATSPYSVTPRELWEGYDF